MWTRRSSGPPAPTAYRNGKLGREGQALRVIFSMARTRPWVSNMQESEWVSTRPGGQSPRVGVQVPSFATGWPQDERCSLGVSPLTCRAVPAPGLLGRCREGSAVQGWQVETAQQMILVTLCPCHPCRCSVALKLPTSCGLEGRRRPRLLPALLTC